MAKMAPITADLSGRVCVVTGANTGMGKETARALATMGATVVMACRSTEKGEAAKNEIAAGKPKGELEVMTVDVSSMASVRGFAAVLQGKHPKIDVLVNNAGAWWPEKKTSADGYELQWATNVLGPHLLTQLLLPALEKSGHGRVVNVASSFASGLDLDDVNWEKRPYNGMKAYSSTKQADRMLTWALAKRVAGKPITVNATNPGLVGTDFNRSVTSGAMKLFYKLLSPITKSSADGADVTVWAAAAPELEKVSDKFFDKRKERKCQFRDPGPVDRLWELCEKQAAAKA